jgi:predicted DNA-binding transcriptional regulator AlpA
MSTEEIDRVIFRPELMKTMNVTSETIRRWMIARRLPAPDVAMSHKTLGWRLSTLRNAGINLAA